MRSVDRGKGLGLLFLTSKRLDNVHPRHVLLHKLIHTADLVAHVNESLFDDLLKNPRRQQQHRNGRQHQQSQLPVHPEHGTNHYEQCQQITYGIEDTIGKHIRNAVNVAHMTGYQGSHGGLIEIAQLELRNVLEQLGTQVQTNRLGHPVGEVRHAVLQEGFKNEHPAHRQKHME